MKAVIYVRVSSKDQEREGFSIPAQKKLLKEYAREKGLQVVQVFEEAETAKKAGRKQFDAMVNFLTATPDVRAILVEKTDRLYRNFRDYVDLDPEKLDLTIHLVKEGIMLSRASKSQEKFFHGIKVLMAKQYIDNLSEEVRKGQTEKASQGNWPSCAPLGYKNRLESRTIVPDPKTAHLIAKAFELAATGQFSLRKLTKALYDHGLRSARSGKQLGKAAMVRVLSNPIYFGEFVWRGKPYQGKHQPLVPKPLYDRVQEVMGFTRKPGLTKHDFAFIGLMKCGHCGSAITAEQKRKKSGRTYVYYHCTNGKGICPNVIYLREEKIEETLVRALSRIQLNPEIVDWTKGALLESFEQEKEFHRSALVGLTGRYQKLQTHIDKCYEDKLEGRIEPDFWERKTAGWKREQTEIEDQLRAHSAANTTYLVEGVRLMELASRAAELFKAMTKEEKRQTVSLVFSNPRVVEGKLEYDYRMPFSMFVNVINLEEWRAEPRALTEFSSKFYAPDIIELIYVPRYKDKSFLHQKYVVEGLSIKQISDQIVSSRAAVRWNLKRFGILLRAHGKPHGRPSQPRYGQKVVKAKAVPHMAELRVIRAAQDMRVQGMSLRQIARFLTEIGVGTKCRGRAWHPEMVKRMLAGRPLAPPAKCAIAFSETRWSNEGSGRSRPLAAAIHDPGYPTP